jgi:hypothetical protein
VSDALYEVRLRWTRTAGGAAILHGVRIQLPPEVPPIELGVPIECLDYTPEVRVQQLQPVGGRADDMTPAQVQACDDYLRRVCGMKG